MKKSAKHSLVWNNLSLFFQILWHPPPNASFIWPSLPCCVSVLYFLLEVLFFLIFLSIIQKKEKWSWLVNGLKFVLFLLFLVRDYSFSTYSKFSEKTNFSYLLIRTRICAYQGVRNVRFSENFAYVLNEWSLMVSHFSQYWSFNIPILACLSLSRSPGKSRSQSHDGIVPLPWKQ